MVTHSVGHQAAGTDTAPGAQTNPMNFSALRCEGSHAWGCDEFSQATFAASALRLSLLS